MLSRSTNFALFAVVAFIMNACSWSPKSQDSEVLDYVPRVVNSIPAPKPPQREPGSLWSDDSRWNDIYSPAQSRYPGDVVTVKIGSGLKAKILAASEAALTQDQRDDRAKQKETAKAGKKGKEEARSIAGETSSQNDSKTFEATIMEVMSRGVYKLSANKGLHIGASDPYVSLTAHVRENDITGEQTVSSENFFNVQMEVIKEDDLAIPSKTAGTN